MTPRNDKNGNMRATNYKPTSHSYQCPFPCLNSPALSPDRKFPQQNPSWEKPSHKNPTKTPYPRHCSKFVARRTWFLRWGIGSLMSPRWTLSLNETTWQSFPFSPLSHSLSLSCSLLAFRHGSLCVRRSAVWTEPSVTWRGGRVMWQKCGWRVSRRIGGSVVWRFEYIWGGHPMWSRLKSGMKSQAQKIWQQSELELWNCQVV